MFQAIPHPTLGMIPTLAVVPRLSATPGGIEHLGLELGAHNEAVYSELLDLTPGKLETLRSEGII